MSGGPCAPVRQRRARLCSIAGVLLALLLSACGIQGQGPVAEVAGGAGGLNGTDVSDVIVRPALSLTDTTGHVFDLRERPAGELTVLYFGYTRCPDVCPTTMADLAATRRQLSSSDRRHLQVVFVTEDPATDTAPVIRRWLDGFDPATIGLVGGDPRTEQALDALKAPHTNIVVTPPAGVVGPVSGATVQHASYVYAFYGNQTVVYTDRTSPADYAADFHEMIAS